MIVVGFWKILGVYIFLYTCDFVFWAWPPCSRYAVVFSLNLKV